MTYVKNQQQQHKTTTTTTTTNMIKSILLSLTLIPTLALANLGDNHQQSNARYGKAYRITTDGITVWSKGGWTILEWFNRGGIVESIMYYQQDGNKISQAQVNQFFKINQIDGKISDWEHIKSEAAYDIWIDVTHRFRYEISWDASVADKPLNRVILSTGDGFLGMEAALRGKDQPDNQVADLPQTDI